MQVLVLADTHLRSGLDRMPSPVLAEIDAADLVLHAGDMTSPSTYAELARRANLYAVLGNNDIELRGALPERVELELDGVRLGMVHDAGARPGRPARLARMFPAAAVVVFGHSHIPCQDRGLDVQLLFNPGSPTQRRTQPTASFGTLRIVDGQVVDHRIVAL